MLAVITESNNIDVYFDSNNGGFARKYSKYLEELQKLKPASQAIIVTRKEQNEATSRTNQRWLRWTANYNYYEHSLGDSSQTDHKLHIVSAIMSSILFTSKIFI